MSFLLHYFFKTSCMVVLALGSELTIPEFIFCTSDQALNSTAPISIRARNY